MINQLFGGNMPAPSEKSLMSLKNSVLKGNYDLGIAMDGDGDRLGIVDKNGRYNLEEYWTPQTGANYEKDVRSKFPGEAADNALNTEKYAEELIKESWRLANEALSKTKS